MQAQRSEAGLHDALGKEGDLKAERHRFEVLDSLRGISAISVALFHLMSAGYLVNNALIGGAWLFVDFFLFYPGSSLLPAIVKNWRMATR